MTLIRPMEFIDLDRGFLETLSHLSSVDLTRAEAQNIWEARTSAGICSIVAEETGRVIGTASLMIEQKFIHRGGLVGHIEDVAVHRDHWRKGIGTSMVDYLTKMAVDKGCYKVILNCLDHLVPFYERIGYHRYDSGLRFNKASAT